MLPSAAELAAGAVVVTLPMRTRFRGITSREVMLLRGPAGWGEFAPFTEYDDAESSAWLAAGIEAAYLGPPPARRDRVAVNATVPAVPADQVAGVLARYPGATTAKVKVAEPGQRLADDVERVAAAREVVPAVRIDANGGWSVDEAVAAIAAIGDVEYAEQPCRTVEELAQVRRRVVAADAADLAILKVAPLGGMRAVLSLAGQIGLPVVVSSALDSAVGMAAGVAAAAALPELDLACGLGTGSLFVDDVAPSFLPSGGEVAPRWVTDVSVPDGLRASPDRERWWRERLARCHAVLAGGGTHGSGWSRT